MDRKDLLMNDTKSVELTTEQESKLRKSCDDGGMYLALVSSSGWKHLMENFINRRISQERYLMAKAEELTDIRAAQREIFDLLNFVNKKIEEGEKAFKMLKK